MLPNAKKTVLLIEDDRDNYDLMKEIFSERHPDVELQWSQDGESAMDRLRSAAADPAGVLPHLVLLDLNLPKISGRDILIQIRKEEELRSIPVVVLSGSLDKDEAAELYRLGASSFIPRPTGYQKLCEFVETFYGYWFKYAILGLAMMLQPRN